MSYKEITELRKAGNLEDALYMANQALETDFENIWNKRAASWIYYEFIKLNSQPDSYSTFKEYLLKLSNLELPEGEKSVFDNTAWQIGSMVFKLNKQDPSDIEKIYEIFEVIKDFHFSKPKDSNSFLYKAFHKAHQNWPDYKAFADWWNFENFLPQDYLKEEYKSRKIMSIAEQAYIAYSKKLLEGQNLEEIKTFLPKLDELIEKQPDYQYPPYFKAKLLLALESNENALSTFLPFARQKKNDFWVWELMADIYDDNQDLQFACLCKALNLKTSEEFLVKLRQKFAHTLVERQMYPEAKTEILQIISTREENKWKIPDQIEQWEIQNWYKAVSHKKDNKDLYLKHLKDAEEILFQDYPEEYVVVEFVNNNKKILNFVQNQEKYGFFKYEDFIKNPEIGDILSVRFNGDGRDGFYKVLTAKKADPEISVEALKSFEGTLTVISPKNIGFVDDVFVAPSIIKENNLANEQNVRGKAILSFNKKKNVWGWKTILCYTES